MSTPWGTYAVGLISGTIAVVALVCVLKSAEVKESLKKLPELKERLMKTINGVCD